VLAVGDLHVENFGTWRDAEGRLIWGVNDFDEAWRLPVYERPHPPHHHMRLCAAGFTDSQRNPRQLRIGAGRSIL